MVVRPARSADPRRGIVPAGAIPVASIGRTATGHIAPHPRREPARNPLVRSGATIVRIYCHRLRDPLPPLSRSAFTAAGDHGDGDQKPVRPVCASAATGIVRRATVVGNRSDRDEKPLRQGSETGPTGVVNRSDRDRRARQRFGKPQRSVSETTATGIGTWCHRCRDPRRQGSASRIEDIAGSENLSHKCRRLNVMRRHGFLNGVTKVVAPDHEGGDTTIPRCWHHVTGVVAAARETRDSARRTLWQWTTDPVTPDDTGRSTTFTRS